MKERSLSLQPFSSDGPLPGLTITTTLLRRSTNTLAIRYALLGDLEDLRVPIAADTPVRKDGLWEETCFELFLALPGSPRYWEINLSPAGHWNVYRFAAYRQGMRQESAFSSLSFSVGSRPGSLSIGLELDLRSIVGSDRPMEIGVSAVVKHRSGDVSYWALTHGGPQADFHRRDGFIVEL